ncbi:hypothetical protein [Wohlfahrtiimonas populi]|uniref:hypothetical protein n=1 Tax=Wohlfahrtiimonas populi TaxID=1940240 RepID=UPI001180182A|nr:hypothetical protein [Wohlfahrtiimonas populi]
MATIKSLYIVVSYLANISHGNADISALTISNHTEKLSYINYFELCTVINFIFIDDGTIFGHD